MKFLSIALFAGAVLGQASVVSDALDNISQKTTALDNAVNAYNGGDVSALQSASTAVIAAINQGNTAVSGIDMLDALGASSLIPNINALASQVDGAVTDLINKKSALAAESDVVRSNLQMILSATNTFASTTYSKVPEELVSTAQRLVAPIIASLNRGIAAFPAGSGGTGPTTTTSSTMAPGMTSSTMVTSGTMVPSVYPVSSTTVVTSAPIGTGSVIPGTSSTVIVPPISSAPATTGPAPYNPNGASQLTGGFAAVVVAAAVAVAAF